MNEPELAECPVCGKRVPQEKINLHLDTCLLQDKATDTKEENMKSQKKLNGDEDMFDDFDDDMLMEAADAAEKSLISIHSDRSVVFSAVLRIHVYEIQNRKLSRFFFSNADQDSPVWIRKRAILCTYLF